MRTAAAVRFIEGLGAGNPFLVVGASRHAADRLVHEAAEGRGRQGGFFGAFRFGLFVLAQQLARPELAARELRTLTPAARLAAVVRIIHRARRAGQLGRFEAAAEGPGLAVRLASTFDELRLAGVTAEEVGAAEESLGRLYGAYLETLAEVKLADRAETFESARRAITNGAGLPVGLPLLLLDVPLVDQTSRRFAAALAAAASEVFLTLPEGDRHTEEAALALGAIPLGTMPLGNMPPGNMPPGTMQPGAWRREPWRREPCRREPWRREPWRREPCRREPWRREPCRWEPWRREPCRHQLPKGTLATPRKAMPSPPRNATCSPPGGRIRAPGAGASR